MKRTIRRGVFETNSSSTHSLTIVSKEDYDAWEKGELLFNKWENVFIKKDENNSDDDDIVTYEEFWDYIELETFEEEHTTKNGDKIIAFGYYGYDG